MSDETAKDQGDRLLREQKTKPLASSDAAVIVNPTAQDKQFAEAERTNQSSGSLAELVLKSRGLTREQIATQMDEQEESISIDCGNGYKASKKSGVTEKDISANAVVPSENQYKITLKPVEETPTLIKTGLDYYEDKVPLSQKLANFAQSAQARLMDPSGRQNYFQGLLDKTLGIGEGLNLAKEEVKDATKLAAAKAWTALNDGSVASFMAKPNAINEPLFRTIGGCLDAIRKDPNAVNKVLTIMGRELEDASNKYSRMTPHERGVQDGKAMFFFFNPSGSTEGGELALKIADQVSTKVDTALMNTVQQTIKAAEEAARVTPELADQSKQFLYDYLCNKGLTTPELEYAGVPKGYFDKMQKLPGGEKGDNYLAMSRAEENEGLGSRSRKGNKQESMDGKTSPSETFKIEIAKAIDNLEPHIQDYLKDKGVEIKACRRIADLFPDQQPATMGCYSTKENCIYIAEEVKRGSNWIKNFDVDFNLRHESGHAFSYTFRGYEQLSSDTKFGKLFAADIKKVPEMVLKSLDFDINSLEGIEYAREEVFADSFAHATGYKTKNDYSRLISEHFPNCRAYFGGK